MAGVLLAVPFQEPLSSAINPLLFAEETDHDCVLIATNDFCLIICADVASVSIDIAVYEKHKVWEMMTFLCNRLCRTWQRRRSYPIAE